MTLRQLIRLARLLNRKASRPITPLQILESVDRNTTRPRRKLQEARLLLRIPATNALPEVLNDLVVFRVAAVVCVFFPVVDVDVGDAADEEFEFAFVEDVDEVGGDELVEAGDEGLELFFDALLNAPFGDESGVVRMSLAVLRMCTYSTYSPLFSFVTSISSPPGLSSMLTVSPKRSSSVAKVSSSASVMSLLLPPLV